MVSTGAFALAIFAIVYVAFEGLYFYSEKTSGHVFFKAALIGVPFLVYVAFYFAALWRDDACVPEGDISTLFAIAFFFSGGAIVTFLLGYMLSSIHSLFYSSASIFFIAHKSAEELCGFKPEFQAFSGVVAGSSVALFAYFMWDEFRR